MISRMAINSRRRQPIFFTLLESRAAADSGETLLLCIHPQKFEKPLEPNHAKETFDSPDERTVEEPFEDSQEKVTSFAWKIVLLVPKHAGKSLIKRWIKGYKIF